MAGPIITTFAAIKDLARDLDHALDSFRESDDFLLTPEEEGVGLILLKKHPELKGLPLATILREADDYWMKSDFDGTLGLDHNEWKAAALFEAHIRRSAGV